MDELTRAQNAEAALTTCKDNIERVKDKLRDMMESLCAREKSDGTIDIDFDALVQKIPTEQALELRMIIDRHHRISGEPGEKPRIRLSASEAVQ